MQITPRDRRILQIAGVVVPLLLLVYFFVLRTDGGEDLALPSGPTGITGSTGLPTESPSVTPSPTPRETLPPVSLAGSRDPFSIPPGLELSTGGSVGPPTTPGAGRRGEQLDVQVDGKSYTVESGATFGDHFKLVTIDGTCATFLFGDQSFELCDT